MWPSTGEKWIKKAPTSRIMQGTIRFTYSKTLKALILNFRTALRSVTRMYSAHSGIDFGIGRERKLTLTLTLILILTLTLYSSFTCWRPHSGGRKHVRINVYVLINYLVRERRFYFSLSLYLTYVFILHVVGHKLSFKLKLFLFWINFLFKLQTNVLEGPYLLNSLRIILSCNIFYTPYCYNCFRYILLFSYI